jgi:hypothetical protein
MKMIFSLYIIWREHLELIEIGPSFLPSHHISLDNKHNIVPFNNNYLIKDVEWVASLCQFNAL